MQYSVMTSQNAQQTILRCALLIIGVTTLCIALCIGFVRYVNQRDKLRNELQFGPSRETDVAKNVMEARTDAAQKALDRHIIVLYDISQGGIFDRLATPRLNKLLV
jgi:hypothetical protein